MTRSQDPVRWIVVLFVMNFCLQRIAVPGLGIPVTVPLSLVWMGLALWFGVMTIEPRRLALWTLACGLSAALVIPQAVFVRLPSISVTSWGFWMVTWLPMVLQIANSRAEDFRRCCRALGNVGIAISALSIAFIASQLVGIRYRDWVAELVPSPLLMTGYTTAYPISYGSEIYKSNAWLALEPSFLSFTLGVTVICAIVVRARLLVVAWLVVGLLSTIAGSGVALLGVYLVTVVVLGQGRRILRYLVPLGVMGALAAATVLGEVLFARISEVATSRSSTSLRAVEPYVHLWPSWASEAAIALFGGGAGSSQRIIAATGITGLLTPNVAKVMFDYGLFGGLLLVAVIVVTYLGTREPAMAFAFAASLLTIQTASAPLVLCTVAALTFWRWSPPAVDPPDSEPVTRSTWAQVGAGRR